MANPENKQIPYESTQKDIRDAIESVAMAIGGIAIPSADHVSYDNSGSGLSATDVQNALDEIVSDIPTVNNGTLTIQQNGTSKGSFTANSASNVNVNIETPTADKKTATDQFNTADGGLLSKCQINLVPVQSGSGDPSPNNVRPISGHTEVDLLLRGKNLCDNSTNIVGYYGDDGTYNSSADNRSSDLISVEPNTAYTASLYDTNDGQRSGNLVFTEWDINEAFIQQTAGNAVTITTTANTKYIRIRNYNAQSTLVKSDHYGYQLEKGSTATSYEPYLGHLYQVQIGSTVYGGTVDLVSGVMNVTTISAVYDGSVDESWGQATGENRYYTGIPTGAKANDYDAISNLFKNSQTTPVNTPDMQFYVGTANVGARNNSITSVADWRTFLSNNNWHIIFNLTTPTTINLTPQQIETIAGQNNLSTPLSGQSIETNGVEYKELFTFADVKEYVKPLIPYSNAGSHNAIYRGKYLGDHVTPEQWASIVSGTFDDLFIGDYWTINSVNWRIAHFDYWLGTGDTECTTPHVVIVPDTNLYTAKMNTSDTTAGGYYTSEMRGGDNYLVSDSSGLYDAKVAIDNAFGSGHILTHRELITTAVSSSGNASGWVWNDSSVDLMSEVMVYGSLAWSSGGKGYEMASSMSQFALFKYNTSEISIRANWWLRGVYSSAGFAHINSYGYASRSNASSALGVRPCFAIK